MMIKKESCLAICIHLGIALVSAQPHNPFKLEHVSAKTRIRDAEGNLSFSAWKTYETRLLDSNWLSVVREQPRSKYGNNTSLQCRATGFFRTEKMDGRWYIVDPEGYAGLSIALNSVNTGKSRRNKAAYNKKFKNKDDWAEKTLSQLQGSGFNGLGSWSDHTAFIRANKNREKPITYTINLGLMSAYGKKRGGTYSAPGHTGYPGDVIFVFDPAFETFCNEQARKLVNYRSDPNLLGYFSDNEMPFGPKYLDNYLGLTDKNNPGYKAAREWLARRHTNPDAISDRDRTEFRAFAAERYFSIVSKAIRKYDPNHLYLGSRFYSKEREDEAFMKAAGKYIDIISINYYGTWTPEKARMKRWADWTGKPFIVTEFYVKGADSGFSNLSGAGWLVKNQEDRGKFYQNYCLGLLASKDCVGWHWFKYQDNDPEGPAGDPSNQDGNKGIVNNDYEVYTALFEKMKQLNQHYEALIKVLDGKSQP